MTDKIDLEAQLDELSVSIDAYMALRDTAIAEAVRTRVLAQRAAIEQQIEQLTKARKRHENTMVSALCQGNIEALQGVLALPEMQND